MTAPITPAPTDSTDDRETELEVHAHAELAKADVDIAGGDLALEAGDFGEAKAHSLAAIARLFALVTRLVVEDGLP